MKSLKLFIYQFLVSGTLMKLLPIRRNWVLFSSFYGQHYSDGPKAISEHLHQSNPELKLFWAFKNIEAHSLPDYVHVLDMNSLKYYIVKAIAKYIISNVYIQTALEGPDNKAIQAKLSLKLSNRKSQIAITTWHGTPLKKIGNDAANSNYTQFICNKPFYYIVGNEYEKEIMMRITQNNLIPLEWGNARNSFLQNQTTEDMARMKKSIGIDESTGVVLLAPTFRTGFSTKEENINNSGIVQISLIDIEKLSVSLNQHFGYEKWVLICRFHNNVENFVDWNRIAMDYKGLILNGNKLEDINDYYQAADLLITDYSSVMFDFMQTKRPIFLLCHDFDNYYSNERGLYLQPGELPFYIAKNKEELIQVIENFDLKSYNARIVEFKKRLGYYPDSEQVYTKLSEFIKKHA